MHVRIVTRQDLASQYFYLYKEEESSSFRYTMLTGLHAARGGGESQICLLPLQSLLLFPMSVRPDPPKGKLLGKKERIRPLIPLVRAYLIPFSVASLS